MSSGASAKLDKSPYAKASVGCSILQPPPVDKISRGAYSDAQTERGEIPQGIILSKGKSATNKSLPLCKAVSLEKSREVPLDPTSNSQDR